MVKHCTIIPDMPDPILMIILTIFFMFFVRPLELEVLRYSKMFQGKRMDCWTLDLILGLHIALHCDLCILDLARLAALASQCKNWIVCVIHILQTFLNQ